MPIKIYFDGGSRGNPGPAGCGYVVKIEPDPGPSGLVMADTVIYKGFAYLGPSSTNNEAEYQGLIEALKRVCEVLPLDVPIVGPLQIYGDSRLVLNQVSGIFKVRSENLKARHREAYNLIGIVIDHRSLRGIGVTYTWIPRSLNSEADALANMAMDQRSSSSF